MKSSQEINLILKNLEKAYPTKSALIYRTPFQLLAAALLSAQSTDAQVNRVTERLFALFPDVQSMAEAELEEVQGIVRGVGLYRDKSKNLIAASRMILEKFGGQVPGTREELMQLPGVGRKTANVVLSNAFGIPALAVDTHVFRVSNRLGLAKSERVLETEKQLEQAVPEKLWGKAHHWLIWHGREVCRSRNPRCTECLVSRWCDYAAERRN